MNQERNLLAFDAAIDTKNLKEEMDECFENY